MARNSRTRLLLLAKRDYRRNAWRRQNDVDELLSQVSPRLHLKCKQNVIAVQFHSAATRVNTFNRVWVPYSMPAVDALRDALLEGTIQRALVPQVIQNA